MPDVRADVYEILNWVPRQPSFSHTGLIQPSDFSYRSLFTTVLQKLFIPVDCSTLFSIHPGINQIIAVLTNKTVSIQDKNKSNLTIL